MAVDMAALVADLAAESADLDRVLAALPGTAWATPTPAAGWTVADQVVHLAHFDQTATTAAVDPDRFRAEADALMAHGDDFTEVVTQANRGRTATDLLAWLRSARAEYLRVFGALDPATPLPWYGPPMSAASSVTARLMETWAHGQDVVDAVGATREPTARLRNIAHLGVATRGWSHRVHGEDPPPEPVRVELTAPDGDTWIWGPPDAADRVAGPALDFCLLVTQRRHRSDLALHATGPVADHWLDVAQAFAGPPGPGRTPA
ncbi:TIGR03084 family metal-binding protein [Klenkia sp. PcliD-1-E]|uniref:TIGR03084 family metal-binding protein n=1 Tax=Klenkia sp. PcliD-1-E TaxID=2954492 RepID=UPI0020985955|nr:TIGR03084 family metal-binding protein [Klenkia sp. PcliD-1-E]MCO7221431.1 TIGR03084 family metal-binding protein [Klenkia sp. PcliD-1-E]